MEHINKLQEAILELADSFEDGSFHGVLHRVSSILACENCGELAGLDEDKESKFYGKCVNCGCKTAQLDKSESTPSTEV